MKRRMSALSLLLLALMITAAIWLAFGPGREAVKVLSCQWGRDSTTTTVSEECGDVNVN